uniref:Uncharacterized protein n=1 Tax=Heterorhabditis bacteriophora TaxID=37862 RepID=A0A1I7W884_HETBA
MLIFLKTTFHRFKMIAHFTYFGVI